MRLYEFTDPTDYTSCADHATDLLESPRPASIRSDAMLCPKKRALTDSMKLMNVGGTHGAICGPVSVVQSHRADLR